ncbi:uncharacterized protein LOC135222925 isoform X3 [Macrobrachium nipponense]|uniref:uncharacterized protein LOC135222925 isoform X3 n=1 Tax=Macrobrachium nipponense TaxID=159736 RepID=UPI0030C8A0D0
MLIGCFGTKYNNVSFVRLQGSVSSDYSFFDKAFGKDASQQEPEANKGRKSQRLSRSPAAKGRRGHPVRSPKVSPSPTQPPGGPPPREAGERVQATEHPPTGKRHPNSRALQVLKRIHANALPQKEEEEEAPAPQTKGPSQLPERKSDPPLSQDQPCPLNSIPYNYLQIFSENPEVLIEKNSPSSKRESSPPSGSTPPPSHNSSQLQEILYGVPNVLLRPDDSQKHARRHLPQQQLPVAFGVVAEEEEEEEEEGRQKMTTMRHGSLLERKKKQWEEERAFMNGAGCGFWGLATPSEPKKATPPTDKPPDPRQKQQFPPTPLQQPPPSSQQQQQQQQKPIPQMQAYQSPQPHMQQMTYHDQQQLQLQQAYQEQQQYQQQHVFQQQQSGPPPSSANQQALVPVSQSGFGGRAPLPPVRTSSMSAHASHQIPTSALPTPQYMAMQPLPVGGYNGAPVYVVMQSPGGAVTPGALPNGPFIPELLRNLPYGSNQRGVTIYELPEGARQHHTRGAESVPMSAAPSEGTRWPGPPEPPKYTSIPSSSSSSVSSGSQDDRNGAGRARWGDRGVGVGHLWAPGDETSPGSGRPPDPLPPAWVDSRDENVLPGAPLSKSCQRTYARGGGMLRMDPEELAEKERRKRQAEETQRIIKQQLEDKKRQRAVEEERERKEAALWEERVKEQQEKEAREYMEEMRKKREKEENEERRQRQLQSAIKEAEDRAKREKELSKYGHLRNNAPMQKGNLLPDVGEEGEDDEESPPQASPSKQQHQTPQRTPSFMRNQQQLQRRLSEQPEQQESEEQQQLQQRPATAHRQGVQKSADVDGDERTRLLRSLGLTPEMLLASSGLLDRTTLLTLLSATAAGQRQPSLLQPDLLQAEYITDRIITPTKYRGPPSRECGIQCDTPVSDRSSPRRDTKRKGSRRNKSPSTSLPRDSGHSSDARPAWGHNHSDRPYRKQSEKDPYSGRRLRRRITRSLSRCDRDTATEESDLPQPQRRRRKTWDKSRQESLSSDLSRSPSPRDRVRTNRSSPASGRKWPPIKGSITPSLPRPLTPEMAKAPPTPSSQSIIEKEEEERDDNDDVVTAPVISALPESRSSSPPVPALIKKLTGASFFDVPEYPPGAEPPGSQSSLVPLTGKGNPKAQRKKSPSVTPVLPEIPTSRPPSKPPSPRSSPSEGGSLSERPSSSTLQPPAGGLKVEGLNGSDSSGAGSPHSRPPTPRRLPPMTPTKSDGSPRSSLATPVFRSSSPPVPAVAKRLSAQLRSAKSAEEPSVGEKQLTPVETPGSPRVASSPGASPASATTSGVSSRPGSATSGHEEDVRTVSVTSSGYESGRRSSGEPRSLSEPLVSPDKWVILKSLSSLRQNLWRRHQELSQQPDSDGSC